MAASSISLKSLCERVKNHLPEDLRKDAWYLVTAASLVASHKPSEVGNLYSYVIDTEHPNLTIEDERRLASRFGDLLMKEWSLVGIPTVLVGVSALARAERYVNKENTELGERRKNIDMDNEILTRGTNFIQKIYKQNLDPIFATWGSHAADFAWMEKAVIYGLFLSDHTILTDVETQLVTLSAMMCQGYAGPTLWHLRGLRRLGRSADDVEMVQKAIEEVAVWAGKSIEGWVRVTDVQDEI